jgi:hypothetical protein
MGACLDRWAFKMGSLWGFAPAVGGQRVFQMPVGLSYFNNAIN